MSAGRGGDGGNVRGRANKNEICGTRREAGWMAGRDEKVSAERKRARRRKAPVVRVWKFGN